MNKKDFYEEIDVTKVSEDEMRRIRIMLDFLKGRSIKKMLDIGSVPEMTEIFASALHCEALGINISERVVNSGKRKSGIRFIQGDIESAEISEKFDLIVCGEVIEHMADVDAFIEKLKGMLDKDGYLLLTIPNLSSLFNKISILFGWQPRGINPSRKILLNPFTKYDYNWGHVSMFTFYAMKKFLMENGFDMLKIGGTHGGHVGENSIKSFVRLLMSLTPSFSEQVIILARKR
jgi:SAM-dependent methyltransferase